MNYAIPAREFYMYSPSQRETQTATDALRNIMASMFSPNTASVVNEIPVTSTIQKIRSMQSWGTNWDGVEVTAVSAKAVANAMALIDQLYSIATQLNIDWNAPNVTASSLGEVVLEWWNHEKKLTLYVDNEQAQYVKVWGDDIDTEMADGPLDETAIAPTLEWLGA
ncbi:hypothetical protein [Sideroxydans sp. CL21]|uniref:hypothetical protein n=1 Tax=Sideroxydans sp. CL21 TaxID=2600596 RepID=UPI0024BC3D74|nr:hypothetical protein [Sideroxydans sp. CL21]